MLTPQEVSEHAFAKASFGGYNMAMVDEFLDLLTEDYTTLYKENATLKAKMKVLVDKVEEYRALATKNNIRIEGSTYDKMIRVQITSDAWKTIYEDMKEKARELSIALSEEE